MANMTLWSMDGKIIVDDNGKPILCDHCPCISEPSSSSSSSSRSSRSSSSATTGCATAPKQITLTVFQPKFNADWECIGYEYSGISTTGSKIKCEETGGGGYAVTYSTTGWDDDDDAVLFFSASGSFVSGTSLFGNVYDRVPTTCLDNSTDVVIWR